MSSFDELFTKYCSDNLTNEFVWLTRHSAERYEFIHQLKEEILHLKRQSEIFGSSMQQLRLRYYETTLTECEWIIKYYEQCKELLQHLMHTRTSPNIDYYDAHSF